MADVGRRGESVRYGQVATPTSRVGFFSERPDTGQTQIRLEAVAPSFVGERHDADVLHPAVTQTLKLGGSGGLLKAMRVMPKVLLFAFWQQFYAYFSGDPFNAYVNSMIECPRPKPPCPVGSHWVGPEDLNLTADPYLSLPSGNPVKLNPSDASASEKELCMPLDKFDPSWSLSVKCMDKDEVVQRTTKLNGLNGWLATWFALFAVFMAGQIIDVVGRRPVLMLFISSNVLVKVMLFASCFLPYSVFLVILFLQNVIEVAFASGVEPGLQSMVTDMSRGNMELRADAFAALGVIMHTADVLAFVAGYPVLKAHMTNYAWFWGPLTIVSLIAFIVFSYLPCSRLEETLDKASMTIPTIPEGKEDEDEETPIGCSQKICRCFAVLCSETIAGFKMVMKDPFLAQFLILQAVTGMAMNGSWGLSNAFLLDLGYEQANASLARPAWHVALVAGAAMSSGVSRHLGPRGAFASALVLMAVGFFICGLGGPFLDHAELFFWFGTVCLGGTGLGILTPSFQAIISIRVTNSEQGKLFSLVIVINIICGLAFGQLWPQLFFDARADGWKKGLPWIASAVAFLIMLIWFCGLCCLPCCRSKPSKEESECSSSEDTESSEEG